jgi:hypothetical protein
MNSIHTSVSSLFLASNPEMLHCTTPPISSEVHEGANAPTGFQNGVTPASASIDAYEIY